MTIQSQLLVGDIVIVDDRFCNIANEESSLGYVYENYTDFDDSAVFGVSILLKSGKDLGGFSFNESKRHLELLCPSGIYYKFENVIKLAEDFRRGFFDPIWEKAKVQMKLNFEEWILTRPPVIQEMAREFPPGKYKIKPGAPYSITCSGSIVTLSSYREDGTVCVVLHPRGRTPLSYINESILEIKHNTTSPIDKLIGAYVEPKWLEPYKE